MLDRIGGTVSVESYPLIGVVRSVQVGRIAPLGPDRVMSGFVKKPIEGPVEVGDGGDVELARRLQANSPAVAFGLHREGVQSTHSRSLERSLT